MEHGRKQQLVGNLVHRRRHRLSRPTVLNEEMEGKIMFDNLEIVERTQRILSAEDASHHSFANSGHTAPSPTVSVGSDVSTTTVPQAQVDVGHTS